MKIKESNIKEGLSFSSEVFDSFYYINKRTFFEDLELIKVDQSFRVNLRSSKEKSVSAENISLEAKKRGYKLMTIQQFMGSPELIKAIWGNKIKEVGAIILGTEIMEKGVVFVPIAYKDNKGRLFLDLVLRDNVSWGSDFFFPCVRRIAK
ncbi:hypothetical protein EOL94_02100 [bacterium]|nr:hypothetical protein [bacterium]